jgi:hypothetical protein
MPPRAKRKRASRPASATNAPAAQRARSHAAGAADEAEATPLLVPLRKSQDLERDLLAAQRRKGHFLDATLVVGGARITAHKLVLAVHSPYLEGLFTSGLAESSVASSGAPVAIHDVDGAAVAACVDSMYSGTIALTGVTVSAVIKASNLLGMTAAEEAACEFFVGRLEPETALDALGFAEGMAAGGAHGQELHAQVLTYVHKHFAECVATPAFVCLASSSLGMLIESDKLCVQSEEVVLSALRRWYEHDTEGRAGALEELVLLVRVPLLPAEVKLQLGTHPVLQGLGSSTVAKLLLECLPEFKASAVAADCPRLKRRNGHGNAFTFASVDNANAGEQGDETGGRFDEAGVLHHIATEGGTSPYVNPHTAGRVVASRSSSGGGSDAHFVAGPCPGLCWTKNFGSNSWMAVDLGVGRRLAVNHYALRHGFPGGAFALRNWELQGSEDGEAWTTLRRHGHDGTMEAKGFFVAHWAVEGVTTPYRHFRVHQHGLNYSGSFFLSCNGIELYGALSEA